MSSKISSRGYGISKDCISDIESLKDELTVKPYTAFDLGDNKEDKSFPVYLESSKKLYLPKYYGLRNYGIPDADEIQEGQPIDVTFKGNLRDYQQVPVQVFIDAARDKKQRGGILQLPPGWGKTVMALNIIAKLKVKTLIIVHKDFLLNQWIERIDQYIGNASVGIIKQKKTETDNDIVIASLQSIAMRNYDASVFEGFGMVVIDEVHHMGAEVFSRALFKVNFQYSLGLSATVNRKDGLTKVFKWFLGDIVYKAKPKKSDELDARIHYYFNSDRSYSNVPLLFNGKPNISRLITNICDFKPRTEFIIRELQKIMQKEPDREVIVLSDRRAHLGDIEAALKRVGYDNIGYYVGGMKQSDLDQSQEKRFILGTYNMVSEGFDLPKLNTLVLASPKGDVEQSIGRIQRQLKEDRNNVPLVLDIVDELSLFINQGNKRKAFYKKKGYQISEKGKLNNVLKLEKMAFVDIEDEKI